MRSNRRFSAGRRSRRRVQTAPCVRRENSVGRSARARSFFYLFFFRTRRRRRRRDFRPTYKIYRRIFVISGRGARVYNDNSSATRFFFKKNFCFIFYFYCFIFIIFFFPPRFNLSSYRGKTAFFDRAHLPRGDRTRHRRGRPPHA